MKHFRAPNESLGRLDAESAAALIAATADMALIIDGAGVILDVALNTDDLGRALTNAAGWIGKPWVETLTVESRGKVEELLRETADRSASGWRHLNYPAARGPDVPVLFSTVRLGPDRLVAVGRDLRAMASLQQRLVAAQQSLERDYLKLRNVEMRYRLLFQMSSEPVLIVDAGTHKIVEINPAAMQLLGTEAEALAGRPFAELFEPPSVGVVMALLVGIQAAGRADDTRATLLQAGEMFVSAHIFRQERSQFFLVRFSSLEARSGDAQVPKLTWKLLKLIESAPDGFVVTDAVGKILSANAAFLELAQLSSEQQARDQSLDRWLGRPGVDLSVLINNLGSHGSVRLFATTMLGAYGATTKVEISAVAVMNSERQCFGFTIRNIGWRLPIDSTAPRDLPRSVEHLAQLVGRVSLKELVREATDVIERMSIEAALELTEDNKASAAEMLGLSRQSLYVKLRRYGLIEPGHDDDDR